MKTSDLKNHRTDDEAGASLFDGSASDRAPHRVKTPPQPPTPPEHRRGLMHKLYPARDQYLDYTNVICFGGNVPGTQQVTDLWKSSQGRRPI
jgi:hypothetical protein